MKSKEIYSQNAYVSENHNESKTKMKNEKISDSKIIGINN